MSKILIGVTDYPDNNGKIILQYIHTRSIAYLKADLDFVVLNFSAKKDYVKDGVKVITLDTYIKSENEYDIFISHAPNVRQHYKFLNTYGNRFKEIVFFYHGHEIMKLSEGYPTPYSYIKKKSFVKTLAQDLYDEYKFKVWRKYIMKNKDKLTLIFVSEWLFNEFRKNLKIPQNKMPKVEIIPNSSGSVFQELTYTPANVEYDFITIRSNIDGSKYCIDLVNQLAVQHPEKKFLLIGKGKYFEHYPKADNIEWINQPLPHKEIINYLNKSRFALLPTKTDAQGVMACEMTSFGIPLITSDIEVCRQVLDGLDNVWFIDNENIHNTILNFEPNPITKVTRFDDNETVMKEVELLNNLK